MQPNKINLADLLLFYEYDNKLNKSLLSNKLQKYNQIILSINKFS